MYKRWMFVVAAVVMIIGLSLPGSGQSAATPTKKVNIAIGQEPVTLDPCLTGTASEGMVVENYGEFLVKKETNGDLVPGLATSWNVSPDGKTIEFTLRKGVKFHSGDPLTAKDAIFSFERVKSSTANVATQLKPIVKMEALDDYRFRFVLKEPDVAFIKNRCFVMIVSKNYYDRVGEDKFTREPVGTGSYKFVRYVPGEYIDIERFEDYWGKKPTVREARIYFVPEDTTRVAKLQAGEVDLIQAVPFNLAKQLESSPNFKTVSVTTGHPNRGISFSNRNPNKPWSDKRVRLAMAYAIDWNTMIKNLFFGIPTHWPWLAPGEIGYDPAVKPYPYDPKRAKALLAEAGYPNGFEMKLYYATGGRVPLQNETVEAIVSYLGAVGIKVKLEPQENETFATTRRGAKKPGTDYIGYTSAGMPGSADPTLAAGLFFGCDGALSAYCNPEMDKLIAEGRATMNEAKRAEIVKRIVKIMDEEVPTILIFNTVSVYGMQKNIDFVPTQRNNIDLVYVKDITVK
jgi:peptide/nickel transport system substrate-binding protein